MDNEVDSITSAAHKGISGLRDDPSLPFTCVPCKEILDLLANCHHELGMQWSWKNWALGNITSLKKRQKCILCRMVLGILLPPSEIADSTDNSSAADADQAYFGLRIMARESIPFKGSRGLKLLLFDQRNQRYGSITSPKEEEVDCVVGYSEMRANKIDPELFSSWIRGCVNMHKDDQKSHLNYLSEQAPSFVDVPQKSDSPLDLIAIDVVDECLVRITTKDQYVALSYVWGGVLGLQLLVSNRNELETSGRLSLDESPGEIPPAIRSAMMLVKQMNERYLWVDRLCIEQNNSAQKHFNISHMDLIYSQALVTFIDLSSSNASEPIAGILSDSRIPVNNNFTFEHYRDRSDEITYTSLRTYPANLKHTLQRSEYEKRAWTFQERLLSPRCLYFSGHMTYYQCRHGVLHCDADDLLLQEDRVEDIHDTSLQERLDPLQLSSQTSMYHSVPREIILKKYTTLVDQYSTRKLGFARDKLNAFSGVLAALTRSLPGGTVGGLPESLIDFCLLWNDVPSPDRCFERNYDFPSWSWASSNLPTSYYNGPLFVRSWGQNFSNQDRTPETGLVSHLEDIGTSFETPIRPVAHIMPHALYIPPEIKPDKKPGKDILHFNAEVCSIECFRISQGHKEMRQAQIRTHPGGIPCGLLYPCSWTINHGSTESIDNKYALVLLSTIECPLRSETPVHRNLLQTFTDDNACLLGGKCNFRHVMLIEWHEHGQWAERVGIASIHGSAWECCQRRRMRITLK